MALEILTRRFFSVITAPNSSVSPGTAAGCRRLFFPPTQSLNQPHGIACDVSSGWDSNLEGVFANVLEMRPFENDR